MLIQICDNCYGVVPPWQHTVEVPCPKRPWYWRLSLRFATWVFRRELTLLEAEHQEELKRR
jgi:hypothetical protein